MTIGQIGVIACALVGLGLAGRILFLDRFRVPVIGRVTRHEFRSALGRDASLASIGDRLDPLAGQLVRSVWARATYDYQCIEYCRDVRVIVQRGGPPDRLPRLWINTTNTNEVTGVGPGYCFMWLLITVAIGALFWKLPF